MDGFVHLDLTAPDPVLDVRSRLESAGQAAALLVETWKGEDFDLLDRLRTSRESRFRLAFCFRPGKPMDHLLADPAVLAIRLRGSEIASAGHLFEPLAKLGKYLLVHSDQGVGPLTNRVLELLKDHPVLKVYFPHLAWPVVDGKEDPDWVDSISKLAGHPPVVIGISALEHFSHEQFPHQDVKRYADQILMRFPPERIIAGSDYPLFLKEKYAEYMSLAIDWIQEKFPQWAGWEG